MGFAIIAEFPLGTYRGHRPDGTLDRVPSPARLHSALLAAAGQGSRAAIEDGRLVPGAADREALRWTEAHPPDGLQLPPLLDSEPATIAYRALGWFSQRWSDPPQPDAATASVAVGGRIGWVWDEPPPEAVRVALDALCADVSHIGTAESPVVLVTGDLEPTHRLDRAATLFTGGGLDLEVAQDGRTAALEAAHARTLTKVRRDALRQHEDKAPPPVERAGLALRRYAPLGPSVPDAPWPTVVVLPLDRAVLPEERVAWCVALHRTLVSLIGDGAPGLVTGHYALGSARPANRLAIHYLDPSWPVDAALAGTPAMALLIPAGADPADLATLAAALRQLRRVWRGRERSIAVRVDAAVSVGSDRFWRPVPEGMTRRWLTEPAALPDSRPPRRGPWTLADAALLSLGLVWRDRLVGPGRGAAWYEALAAAATAHGARVLDAARLHGERVEGYAHRVPEGTLIAPYRAVVELGELAGERTVLAIGQSRHLGGGLLVPIDVATASDGGP